MLVLAALALALVAEGCNRETTAEAPPPRPVRTVIAEKSELGQSVVLTGQILAEKESALAFRIGGRILERSAGVGDRVTPDQVLAKLDPQNELNALRSARAALSAAQGRLEQDANQFQRQQQLLDRGFTTRVLFDQAQQAYRTAEAGEVVQAGHMVFQVARDTGWDAVFDVPAQVIRAAPADAEIVIALTDDPSVTAKGRVRQVDPQADP